VSYVSGIWFDLLQSHEKKQGKTAMKLTATIQENGQITLTLPTEWQEGKFDIEKFKAASYPLDKLTTAIRES